MGSADRRGDRRPPGGAARVSRPRSLSLRVPLYGARVQVFAEATARDARDAAARRPGLRELPPLAAGELGACLALPDGGPIVLALPFTASPGIVAHECAHAAAEVLARASVFGLTPIWFAYFRQLAGSPRGPRPASARSRRPPSSPPSRPSSVPKTPRPLLRRHRRKVEPIPAGDPSHLPLHVRGHQHREATSRHRPRRQHDRSALFSQVSTLPRHRSSSPAL